MRKILGLTVFVSVVAAGSAWAHTPSQTYFKFKDQGGCLVRTWMPSHSDEVAYKFDSTTDMCVKMLAEHLTARAEAYRQKASELSASVEPDLTQLLSSDPKTLKEEALFAMRQRVEKTARRILKLHASSSTLPVAGKLFFTDQKTFDRLCVRCFGPCPEAFWKGRLAAVMEKERKFRVANAEMLQKELERLRRVGRGLSRSHM